MLAQGAPEKMFPGPRLPIFQLGVSEQVGRLRYSISYTKKVRGAREGIGVCCGTCVFQLVSLQTPHA